jgi:GAF domain-containing protein
MDDRTPAGYLAALLDFFVHDGTFGDTLRRVAVLACDASGGDMAGLTMIVDDKVKTGVFTDEEAVEIDDVQYSTGQGPCLDAFRNLRVNRIESTETDDRWPAFSAAAAAHGIASTISVPVIARDRAVGALNVYSRRAGAFDDDSEARLSVFANQSAIVLANAQLYWDARTLNENLNQAMRSRATIDQATGILMAQTNLSPEAAFGLLVQASQRENRKLREIALEIVERTERRTEPTDSNEHPQ